MIGDKNICLVHVKKAHLTRSNRIFSSRMLPLCIVQIEGVMKHTGAKEKGTNPYWHQTLIFNFREKSNISIRIEDQDDNNELISQASLSLNDVKQGSKSMVIPLVFKGQSAGTLDVQIEIKQVERLRQELNKSSKSTLSGSDKCLEESSLVKRIASEKEMEQRKYTIQQMQRILSSQPI